MKDKYENQVCATQPVSGSQDWILIVIMCFSVYYEFEP